MSVINITKENFEELDGKTVKIAGRIVARRIMGKASFVGLIPVNAPHGNSTSKCLDKPL